MAGLYAPLPTLRSHPRGGLRTDRGRRGWLLLHRSGLSPHTPCRSPGALTRVAACTLARSPIRDPLSEGFRHFVASMPAPVASGWSESPGGPRTHWKAPPCHGARGMQINDRAEDAAADALTGHLGKKFSTASSHEVGAAEFAAGQGPQESISASIRNSEVIRASRIFFGHC